MQPIRTATLLGAAIALAIAGGFAVAQTAAPKAKTVARTETTDAAREAELAAARRELDRAARRVAELSRGHAEDDRQVHIIERRIGGKPVIGVLLAPDAQAGVRIAGVTPDSGAAKAGLKAGDRITSVGGTQVLGSTGELRIDNARKLLGDLDADKPVRIGYVRDGRSATATVTPRMDRDIFWIGTPGEGGPRIRRMQVPGVAPDVHQEIIRIAPRGDCKGKDCKFPALTEAFRWNGLNLATVDAQLGRYFGTDRGVLVLSTGPELAGLQAGDVLQKIDGRAVASPREAMEALRAKPENAMALVEYLRDRKVASTRVKVPKLVQFKMPTPPVPPVPPVPPTMRAPKAPPAPPPPPAPPAAVIDADTIAIFRDGTRIASVGADGSVHEVVLHHLDDVEPPPVPEAPTLRQVD